MLITSVARVPPADDRTTHSRMIYGVEVQPLNLATNKKSRDEKITKKYL